MLNIVDQAKTFEAIKARMARTTNPRHLTMLGRLLDHARGEAQADLDAVMATLSPNPIYHSWSSPPALSPIGRDAVHKFYVEEVVNAGRYFFEMDIDRMVVDDDAITTEGYMRTLYLGRDARRLGLRVDDDDGFYVMKVRLMIVWPFDADGFITGEDSYSAPAKEDLLTKVDPADVPQAFKEFLAQRAPQKAS